MGKRTKATGIVRRIDPLGRIGIPKEIRRTQSLPEGTSMEFYVTDEGILLKKYAPVDESDLDILVQKTELLLDQFPENGELWNELLDVIRVFCRVRKELGNRDKPDVKL